MTGKTQFYMARRGPTVSAADFPERWRQHFALFSRFEMKGPPPYTSGRYLLVDQALSGKPTDSPPFDGLAISTFDDLDTLMAFREMYPELVRAMKADEAIVFGGDIDRSTCFGDRQVVTDGKRTGCAIVLIRQRRAGIPTDVFADAWLRHLALLLMQPGIAGRVRHAAHSRLYPAKTADYAYDGMTELWVDAPDEMRTVIAAILSEPLTATEADWVIPGRSRTMATRVLPRK